MDYTWTNESDLDAKIIFIAGGPGCGKGTQCEKLVNKFKFRHVSVGDLFRAEMKKNPDFALKVREYIDQGQLVPEELVIDILLKSLRGSKEKFIIDGFPRNLDQAIIFEQKKGELLSMVLFDCPESVIRERLNIRMNETPEDQRRSDDKPDVMNQRVLTYFTDTMHALNFYKRNGKCRVVNAIGNKSEVFNRALKAMTPNII